MKRQLSVLLVLYLSLAMFACGSTKGDSAQKDNIEVANISVKNVTLNSIILGNTPQQIVSAFGSPTATSTEFWEMDEKDALIYDYNSNKFKFLGNQLESYELVSSAYLVGNDSIGSYFKVGGNLNEVSPYLPNWASKKKDGILSANITSAGQQTDKFIYIQYAPATEIIINISIRTY